MRNFVIPVSVKVKISFSDISENNRTFTDRGEDNMKKIYGYASYVLSFIKNTQLIKAR